jgi:gliding motility-associated transport system permease protein
MLVVFKRELKSYFATPLAAIFIILFLVLSGIFTFFLGDFFSWGQADLQPFFAFHPWLYLFFIPAISMRLWAEERKSGTIEVLLTLPFSITQVVFGKFLAAWIFTGLALALTFPMWLTVSYLGQPDHGVILASYIGSFLMAGAFIAIGSCFSAFTKNQVIAFVIGASISFTFVAIGSPLFLNFLGEWTPKIITDTFSGFSFLSHFNDITKGVIDLRDLVFFGSVIIVFLYINVFVVDHKKAV